MAVGGEMKTHKKINISNIDPSISEEMAIAFIDHRAKMGKKYALTQRAFDKQMKNALEAYRIKTTPNELIEFVVDETSWQAINIEWAFSGMLSRGLIKPAGPANVKPRSTRDIPIEEQVNDRSWAEGPEIQPQANLLELNK